MAQGTADSSVKVAIGYCHPETVSAFWHQSLLGVLRHSSDVIDNIIAIYSSPKIDSARNSIFRAWLESTEATHLFMCDTDMILPPDIIERLLSHNKRIVSGLAFCGSRHQGIILPAVMTTEGDPPSLVPMWEYPLNSVIPVTAVGGACLLVKRDVAEHIRDVMGEGHPLPWFAYGMHNGVEIGEDVGFCLRAAKCGYNTWVDTGLIVPHVKTDFLEESAYVLSLSKANHPHYNEREKVPIYQELVDGHTSLDSDKSGS